MTATYSLNSAIGREDLAAQCRAERTEEMGRKEEIRSFLNEDPSNKPEGDGMDRLDSEVKYVMKYLSIRRACSLIIILTITNVVIIWL